jgi:hypothetical protein
VTKTFWQIGYWVRIEIAVLAIAGLMALIGAFVWSATIPRPFFAVDEMVLPSCLTWALLAPLAAKASLRQALLMGLASPFAGAAFAILLKRGPVKELAFENMDPSGFLRVLVYAWSYIGITAWTTLPIGVTTGFLVHRVFVWFPRPTPQSSS